MDRQHDKERAFFKTRGDVTMLKTPHARRITLDPDLHHASDAGGHEHVHPKYEALHG